MRASAQESTILITLDLGPINGPENLVTFAQQSDPVANCRLNEGYPRRTADSSYTRIGEGRVSFCADCKLGGLRLRRERVYGKVFQQEDGSHRCVTDACRKFIK